MAVGCALLQCHVIRCLSVSVQAALAALPEVEDKAMVRKLLLGVDRHRIRPSSVRFDMLHALDKPRA